MRRLPSEDMKVVGACRSPPVLLCPTDQGLLADHQPGRKEMTEVQNK